MAVDLILLALVAPVVGALLTMTLFRSVDRARVIALLFSLVPLALATWMWAGMAAGMGSAGPGTADCPPAPQFAHYACYPWIPAETGLGISIAWGLDGISMPLFWLTALLLPLSLIHI